MPETIAPTPPLTDLRGRWSSLRVLLVDDNPDDRMLTARELRRLFPVVQIEEAADATSLHRALEAGAFDVVITDFQMGWMDGLEVLESVRKRYPDRPVIMFTGTGSEEIAVVAMKSGLDDYVTKKPQSFKRLPNVVAFALQRHESERERARIESRLLTLLNQLDVGVFRGTLDGWLLEANPAFLRLLGMASVLDGGGRNLHDLFFPDTDRESVLRRLREDGSVRNHEVVVDVGGKSIWVSITETLGSSDGNGKVVDGILEDITPRKCLAEALQKSYVELNVKVAELKREVEERRRIETDLRQEIDLRREAERRRADLVAVVSHELRTPLSSIHGSLGIVLRDEAGAFSTRARTLFEIAQRSTERMLRLVNDLLDMHTLETARVVLLRTPVDLTPLVRQAVDVVGPIARSSGVRVEVEGGGPDLRVSGDGDRLVQVLTNLLSNAVRHSPPEGTVSVSIAGREGIARVSVTDRGKGIPEEIRGRIFEKFVRAADPAHGAREGTGLGLSISRAIVQRLGGRIGFDTDPGRGTTFWFELPALSPDAAA